MSRSSRRRCSPAKAAMLRWFGRSCWPSTGSSSQTAPSLSGTGFSCGRATVTTFARHPRLSPSMLFRISTFGSRRSRRRHGRPPGCVPIRSTGAALLWWRGPQGNRDIAPIEIDRELFLTLIEAQRGLGRASWSRTATRRITRFIDRIHGSVQRESTIEDIRIQNVESDLDERFEIQRNPAGFQNGHRCLTCGFPAVVVVELASSRACDGTDALPHVRPPDGLDGTAGAFFGVEGRRVADAAPRSLGAAAAEPPAEAGLGRPGGSGCPGPAVLVQANGCGLAFQFSIQARMSASRACTLLCTPRRII